MDTTWVELLDDPIPMDRVRTVLSGDPSVGGIVTFAGVRRNDPDDAHGAIVRLEYDAYRAMALKQLRELAGEAIRRWSLARVVLVHRLGAVPVTEASIVIGVASAHRDGSFAACRWLIDTVKQDVPIWKKDVREDGTVSWVSPGFVAGLTPTDEAADDNRDE